MKERRKSDGEGRRRRKREWVNRAVVGSAGRRIRGYKWAKHRSVRMPRSRLQVARPPINMSAGNTTAAWHTAPRLAASGIPAEPRRGAHGIPRRVPRAAPPNSSSALGASPLSLFPPLPAGKLARSRFQSLFVSSFLSSSFSFFLSPFPRLPPRDGSLFLGRRCLYLSIAALPEDRSRAFISCI